MRTPSWWQDDNPVSMLLTPFALAYGAGARLRQKQESKGETLPVPVLCIGNLVAGGAGKTPTCIAIGEFLKARGIDAFYLSRGYGGAVAGPLRVDPATHDSAQVGDEPLLLARVLPTVVAHERREGARYAIEQGAKLLILDDGFQNPTIRKTLSLLVVDAVNGFGNGRLIPAGPLREPVADGLKRAHGVILIGQGEPPPEVTASGLPVLNAEIRPAQGVPDLHGKRVVAFSGIAYPQKFRSTLAALGAEIIEFHNYPDHYAYCDSDLEMLTRKAATLGATLMTTAKDRVRLSASWKEKVQVLDVTLHFRDRGALERVLAPLTAHHEA